jgi:signal peptidase I
MTNVGQGAPTRATSDVTRPSTPQDAPEKDAPAQEGDGQPTSTPRAQTPKSGVRRALEWAAVLLVAGLLALGLRTFAFEVFSVPSGSMEPTIQVGDRILVDKLFFDYHSLKAGDIVVFRRPPRDVLGVCAGPEVGDLVKRVVGLPGQTISSQGNTILIDGHPQAEPYLPANTPLGRPIQPPVHIPKNHYFVLGDNRADSCDSRYWGTISGSSIVGRVIAVIWRHGHPYLHTF